MEQLLQPFQPKGFYVDFSAYPMASTEASELPGPSGVHPGGIEGLLPPLTQLVQLLVAEAKVRSSCWSVFVVEGWRFLDCGAAFLSLFSGGQQLALALELMT